MKFSLLFALLFGLSSVAALAQSYTVSGYVRDALTGESLIGCKSLYQNRNGIYFPQLQTGNYGTGSCMVWILCLNFLN